MRVLRVSLFPRSLLGLLEVEGLEAFCRMHGAKLGMSKQSHEPGVVLGYKECGHIDVSQRSPFIEEKRFTEPKAAE